MMTVKGNQRELPTISIISAFHNLLPYNQIFWEMLKRYTHYSFELIVVDNVSSDASADFFRSVGATVLKQTRNCNYSEAMNIGTEKAVGDFICHMNNDVIVGVDWDKTLIEAMQQYSLDFASPASIELMPTYAESKKALKRWRQIQGSKVLTSKEEIIETWGKMYLDWEKFCQEFEKRNRGKLLDAINGHTVMIRRSAWENIGRYDERMLATDWDLYLRTKKNEFIYGDIIAPKVVLWSYVHHFMGATAHLIECPYDCKADTIYDIKEKWSVKELDKYWPFPMHLYPAPKYDENPISYLKYALKRFLNLYEWGDNW